MNNKEFKKEIEKSAAFQKELDSRFAISKEIIINLYNKHFHNYNVRISNVFGWMNKNTTVGKDNRIYYWDEKTRGYVSINAIYYSNDVRGIAKQARVDFYAAIRKNATDKLSEINRELYSQERKIAHAKNLLKSTQLERDRQQKMLNNCSRKKARNLGSQYRSAE